MGIVIAGLGMRGPDQVTAEVERELRAADLVLHSLSGPAALAWVRSLARAERDLNDLYVDGAARIGAYQAMAELVLEHAEAGRQVALVVYGHPCVLHTGVQLTLRAARRAGIRVTVLPGISSIDALLAAAGVDPGFGGLQILEATDLLLYRRRLHADGHVVILQPACVGPRIHRADGHQGHDVAPLLERLSEVYPPGHHVLHVQLASPGARSDSLRWIRVAALSQERWSNASTLYLPPAQPSIPDPATAGRLGITLS